MRSRSGWSRIAPLVLALALGSGGCGFFRSIFGGKGQSETERRIAWARGIAEDDDPDPETLARAGWVLLLYANDVEAASAAFDHPGAKGNPEAALGRGELARVRMAPREAGAAYLEVLAGAPDSRAGELAQSRLEDLAGLDTGLDTRMAAALSTLIASPELPPLRRVEARRQRIALLTTRGDLEGAAREASATSPSELLLVGPFSRYRALHARRAFDPELEPLVRASGKGSRPSYAPLVGASKLEVQPRRIPIGPGGLHPGAIGRWGDIWYTLTDLIVEEESELLLTWETGRDLRIMVDGLQLMRRDAIEGREPSRGTLPLTLPAGRHRLAVRFLRRVGEGPVKLSVLDADGRPAKVLFDLDHLDREIQEPLTDFEPPTRDEELADDPVEVFWTALLEVERDPARSRRALRRFLEGVPLSGLGHLHAVQILTADPDLGSSLATGRMAQHLQQATALLPGLAATWAVQGAFSFDQSHEARAREAFEKALALAPDSPRLAEGWSRFLLQRGHSVLAERVLDRALSTWPDACPLWNRAYQVRTDEEDLGGTDTAAAQLRGCGLEGLERWAIHQTERGQLGAALEGRRRLLDHQPERVGRRLDLAATLTSLSKLTEAEALLAEGSRIWPEEESFLRQRALLADRQGATGRATRLRAELLKADPDDLSLRRARAFERDEVLLDWGARDLEEEIQRYLESGQALRAGASAVEVVDHAVAEVFVDDPRRPVVVERIQSVTEVLTKEGLDRHGEVSLPGGAEVLEIYVRKPDGRRLYADAAMGRENLSLPGLEPGDFVVTDYLTQVPSRGAALPGWAASAFYFRVYDLPLYRSSYVLRAPRQLPLEVDGHQLEVKAPVVEGEFRVFRHAVENATALHPEFGAPASAEILPWVQVGAGMGPGGYGFIWGDYLQGRDRPSEAMVRLAREIEAEVKDRDDDSREALIFALARVVHRRIAGRVPTTDFDATAAEAFAAGRGNRLLVLRGLLRALEIESNVGFVRSFVSDPATYRFPGPRRFTHAVLEVRVPGRESVWIDPDDRGAPIGTLRPVHAGQPVLMLATPRLNPVEKRTPVFSPELELQETEVDAVLEVDGSISVLGREAYRGHSGASVRVSLEAMEPDRRRQAIQALLASTFGPVLLDTLEFENDAVDTDPGAPLTIHYLFEAPQWVQKSGDQLVVPGAFFPLRLGRTLLRHGHRELPLLLDRGSPTSVLVKLELPEGHALVGEAPVLKLDSPFGRYLREVTVTPEGITLRRTLHLNLMRVAPGDYEALAAFLMQIDAAEARPLVIAPISPSVPTPISSVSRIWPASSTPGPVRPLTRW